MKRKDYQAEVTVFLAMITVSLLLFLGALMRAGEIQISKYYKRWEADIAVQSVFGEYHERLYDEFDIFGIDATYESKGFDLDHIRQRLKLYGMSDTQVEFVGVQHLTDYEGAAAREQIVKYIEMKFGFGHLAELINQSEEWERLSSEGIEQNELEDGSLGSEELDGEEILGNLTGLDGMGMVQLVLPKGKIMSQATVNLDQLPSRRTLNHGYGGFLQPKTTEVVERFALTQYSTEKFQHAADEERSQGLSYELEYLVAGESSDAKNLEGVVHQLLLVRTGANYLCLMNSSTKQAEVAALSLTLATAVGVPSLESALKQALLLGWAYGESVMDIRSLLEGHAVELIKQEKDWQLSLSGLFLLGTAQDKQSSGSHTDTGLYYEDYIEILLYLKGVDLLTMRILNLIEMRISEYGSKGFQVDYCISKLDIFCTASVPEGYQYGFPIYYGYR